VRARVGRARKKTAIEAWLQTLRRVALLLLDGAGCTKIFQAAVLSRLGRGFKTLQVGAGLFKTTRWIRLDLFATSDTGRSPYSRSLKNLARQLSHHSYKSAFTGSQRPICKSGATVGVRGFCENGCMSCKHVDRRMS